MNKHRHYISHHDEVSWYRSPPVLMSALFITLCVWFVLSMSAIREVDLRPTHLTLKGERCAYLRTKGIQITPIAPKGLCTVIVPFRENVFTDGGVIRIGDGEMKVADSEIIEVGATVDTAWTPTQTRAVALAGICLLVMLGLMAWMTVN